MPQATATIKKTKLMSGKFFLSFVHPRWETGSQLYQKRQLRKLANFSNPIQSTRNTLDSFLGKQLRRKWKIGRATFNSSGFSATGILPVKIFCLNINLIWRVDCHRVMLCSRISVGHSMGKTTDLSSFDINIFLRFQLLCDGLVSISLHKHRHWNQEQVHGRLCVQRLLRQLCQDLDEHQQHPRGFLQERLYPGVQWQDLLRLRVRCWASHLAGQGGGVELSRQTLKVGVIWSKEIN